MKATCSVKVLRNNGMGKKIVLRLSPSKVSIFERCPRLYKFIYLDKLSHKYKKPKPYLTMSNHIHETLKDFFSIVPVRMRSAATIEIILKEKWQRYNFGFSDSEDERRWLEKALAELKTFVLTQDVRIDPYLLEKSLEVEITPWLTLAARVDRVDKMSDGRLHVIDYKTGARPEGTD